MDDDFNPQRDTDRAYLAAAPVGFALGLKVVMIPTYDRGAPVHARARHTATYLACPGLGTSLSRVAGAFGRDRSTFVRLPPRGGLPLGPGLRQMDRPALPWPALGRPAGARGGCGVGSWRPKTRAPRQLQEREVRLLRLRGGMLARTGGQWTAYRNHDIRRVRVGVVPDDFAEHLVEDGAAPALEGPALRLAAGARLQA